MITQTITTVLLLIVSTQFVLTFGQIFLTDYAQSNFTVNLLRKIAKNDKSAILSPISISSVVFAVYLAADGETKQQLKEILGGAARGTEIEDHFARLLADFNRRENEDYTLNMANRFYVRQEFSTKKSFAKILEFYYCETLHKFNYEERNELAQEVNNWVSEKTNNKIIELMTGDNINEDTVMLLLNAIYFNGTWETQFNDKKTHDEIFYVSENETKNVSMMAFEKRLPYYEDNFVKVVKLPYIGEEVEMILILPKTSFGLRNVLENISGEDLLFYIDKAEQKLVSLKLPKFRLEADLNLKEILQEIGIVNAFSRAADFRKLTDQAISVSDIVHKSFIEVNEKGTESAAATAVYLEDRIYWMPEAFFIADQPFLFAIVKDRKTILFAGQFAK
ncbi:Heterochromatin-associated protein MENT [Dirofilaria immitis]